MKSDQAVTPQPPAVAAARGADARARGAMHLEHEERLTRMAAFRMDARLRGRGRVRGEVNEKIRKWPESMDEIDREVLALRHFEQLTSVEAAQVLGIQERAAAKRYLRALRRLKDVVAEMPGGLTGLRP
jgi:DNA-directed RNA polymerase specialized sigma24 family protein